MIIEPDEQNRLIINSMPFQQRFLNSKARLVFMESGWSTGKSMCLIMKAMEQMEIWKNNLGVLFRKEFTDLFDSTMKDFEFYTEIKPNSHRNVDFKNGSRLMFRHIEEMNNIQNMNLGFFGIEQGEELKTDMQFFKLFGRLRRNNSSRQGYVIANKNGHDWIYKLKNEGVYDDVNDPKHLNRLDEHIEATSFDNKDNISPDTWSLWYALKRSKPEVWNRFIMNSDEENDMIDTIIPGAWITAAVNRGVKKKLSGKRIIIIDPADQGIDETVVYGIEDSKIIDEEIYGKKTTMETAGRALRMKKKLEADIIGLDGIGIGAGIRDRLRELIPRQASDDNKFLKNGVYDLQSAGESSDPKRWANLRAEIWEYAATQFENDVPSITDDTKLIEELKCPRYLPIRSNGRLQVESKLELKKPERLGRSPNRADAYVMGLWVQKYASVQEFDESSSQINYKSRKY